MRAAGWIAALAMLALAACDGSKGDAGTAAPDAKPGIVVEGARLVLPAVKANPGAAYFTVTNKSDKLATLAAVFIDGSEKAEMHETKGMAMSALPTLDIRPGEAVAFAPGGKHVMAFSLADKLVAGGKTEMTLSFSDGDKVSTPVTIEAPGGGEVLDMGHGEQH